MKMWTLIKHEIRSTLLSPLLVFPLLLCVGLGSSKELKQQPYGIFGEAYYYADYSTVFFHGMVPLFPRVMTIACIALAISVAWIQFGRPSRQKEWSFLLHRPIRRWRLVLAKLIGGGVALLAVPMLAWFAYWLQLRQMTLWEYGSQQLFEGWLISMWGFAAYLAAPCFHCSDPPCPGR